MERGCLEKVRRNNHSLRQPILPHGVFALPCGVSEDPRNFGEGHQTEDVC